MLAPPSQCLLPKGLAGILRHELTSTRVGVPGPRGPCACTNQAQRAGNCTALSTIADPCNGNISGSAIFNVTDVFCSAIAASTETAFVYNHNCRSVGFGTLPDPQYACDTTADCVDGEVCIGTPNGCNNFPVCAVVAQASNCGKTFNCGAKATCPSGAPASLVQYNCTASAQRPSPQHTPAVLV